MGSIIEINDTLQLKKDQGFPSLLDLDKHLQTPISLREIKDTVFEFYDKPGVRVYKMPPVRNFLVENKDGKWIYWGLVHIIETTCDYVNKTTSGKFKIIFINNPEEMKYAHELIDRNPETQYFK